LRFFLFISKTPTYRPERQHKHAGTTIHLPNPFSRQQINLVMEQSEQIWTDLRVELSSGFHISVLVNQAVIILFSGITFAS